MDSTSDREDFLTRQRRREEQREGFVPAWRKRALAGEKYGRTEDGESRIIASVEAAVR